MHVEIDIQHFYASLPAFIQIVSDVNRRDAFPKEFPATPVKRMFWSIISDYDLRTGLCELVDNALDMWTTRGRMGVLRIAIELDVTRQFISVIDDAGGVKRSELPLLITPVEVETTQPRRSSESLVWRKRASIALGEHVEIKTRHKKQASYELDITKAWLSAEDWGSPCV